MRKNLIVGLVAGVLIIAGVSAIIVNTLPKDMTNKQTTVQNEAQTPEQPTAPQPEQPPAGSYTEYSATKLSSTKGTKILFFHASWCPQCRALEKSIKEGQIPAGVTIFKVNYDTNQVLRQQYGVTIQTTLVKVDDNGALIAKYVAYEHPTLQALIDNLL